MNNGLLSRKTDQQRRRRRRQLLVHVPTREQFHKQQATRAKFLRDLEEIIRSEIRGEGGR